MSTIQVITQRGTLATHNNVAITEWIDNSGNQTSTVTVRGVVYDYFGEVWDAAGQMIYSTYAHPKCAPKKLAKFVNQNNI